MHVETVHTNTSSGTHNPKSQLVMTQVQCSTNLGGASDVVPSSGHLPALAAALALEEDGHGLVGAPGLLLVPADVAALAAAAAHHALDVVLHEQMGDELFNENMLQNLLDLRDRVLRPGGLILPAIFRLFAEPVTFEDSMRIRRFWNIDLPDDIDLAAAEHSPVAQRFNTGRNDQFWARPGSVASTIGEPHPILEFDLHSLESLDSLNTDHLIDRTASADAIVDGCCVWFEADFDGTTTLSTSPMAQLTSWGNRIFRLDQPVTVGTQLRLNLRMGQLFEPSTWSVDLLGNS